MRGQQHVKTNCCFFVLHSTFNPFVPFVSPNTHIHSLFLISPHTLMISKFKRYNLLCGTTKSPDSCNADKDLDIRQVPPNDKSAKHLDSPTGSNSKIISPTTKAGEVSKPRKWTNWAGNQTCRPSKILRPTTLQGITDIVRSAKEEKKTIRCVAGAHTWSSSSLVDDGLLVFVNRMTKIFSPVYVEDRGWTVEVETGVTVKALDDYLRKHNPPLAMTANIVLDTVRKNMGMSTKMS